MQRQLREVFMGPGLGRGGSCRAASWQDCFGAASFVEAFFVIIFTLECLLKNIAMGTHYWGDGWNIFDALVVALSLLDVLLQAPCKYIS